MPTSLPPLPSVISYVERVGAVEVRRRCVGEAAAGGQHHAAVRRAGDRRRGHRQRVGVGVGVGAGAVVGQHVAGHRDVLVGGEGIVGGHRRRVEAQAGVDAEANAGIAFAGEDGGDLDAGAPRPGRRVVRDLLARRPVSGIAVEDAGSPGEATGGEQQDGHQRRHRRLPAQPEHRGADEEEREQGEAPAAEGGDLQHATAIEEDRIRAARGGGEQGVLAPLAGHRHRQPQDAGAARDHALRRVGLDDVGAAFAEADADRPVPRVHRCRRREARPSQAGQVEHLGDLGRGHREHLRLDDGAQDLLDAGEGPAAGRHQAPGGGVVVEVDEEVDPVLQGGRGNRRRRQYHQQGSEHQPPGELAH